MNIKVGRLYRLKVNDAGEETDIPVVVWDITKGYNGRAVIYHSLDDPDYKMVDEYGVFLHWYEELK